MMSPGSAWRRRIVRSLRIAGYLLAAWLLVSWAVAYRLTHRSRAPFPETAPAVAWGAYESHRLSTGDGHEIGAWYAQGREDAPSILLLHGNKGSRWNCLDRAELLGKEGCSALLISLRAHGDSTGDYNDIGYGARGDVVAAVEFLEHRRPGKPIVILGTSLGGAAALFAAGELGHRVSGYILESPYRDLRVAVRNRTENELPPLLDWIAYRGLLTVAPLVLPHLDRISPHEAIGDVPGDVPVLILAGDDDLMARRDEAEALFDRVRSHGDLLNFPNAGHLGMMATDPVRYRRAVLDFIGRCSAPEPRSGRGG
ncbi:alpha/beta hydrolase [Tundrisphaera sp. TA3]|uniref:alpha/beta hydrolase n=1 Tax=Tundrisphaera sp. TA3 TaxID=3435775 RepID=UPI003EB72D70